MYEFSSLVINNGRHESVKGALKRYEGSLLIKIDERSDAGIFTDLLRNRVKVEFIEFRSEDNSAKGIAGPFLIRNIVNNNITLSK